MSDDASPRDDSDELSMLKAMDDAVQQRNAACLALAAAELGDSEGRPEDGHNAIDAARGRLEAADRVLLGLVLGADPDTAATFHFAPAGLVHRRMVYLAIPHPRHSRFVERGGRLAEKAGLGVMTLAVMPMDALHLATAIEPLAWPSMPPRWPSPDGRPDWPTWPVPTNVRPLRSADWTASGGAGDGADPAPKPPRAPRRKAAGGRGRGGEPAEGASPVRPMG